MIRAATLLPALVGLAAAMPARAENPAHPDLTIGVSSFPTSMHPYTDPESIKSYILGFAEQDVVAYDADRNLACMLCTRVPTVENGDAVPEGAGMAVTFHFRPGLHWGDGAPLGAADLAFTARVGRDPASGFANTQTWSIVTGVDVVDPLTAVLHYSQPTYVYNQIGDLLPAHLEQPVFDAAHGPGAYSRTSVFNRDPTNPGLYNGPYRVTGYTSGAQVVLEPNPQWPGKPPAFRRVVIKTIGNTAALQANLLSGDVDMVPGEGVGLTLDQVLVLQKQYPDRFTYAYKPNLTYTHIDLQLDNPILADVRVRRAMLMGIDRQSLVDKTMGGRVPVATSFVNPQERAYTTDGVATYQYDPAAARALLAQAGWTPGDDGICRNAAGQRLSLVFTTSTGVRARELQQQVMQSQWRSIGVETTIKNEPPRTLFGDSLKHRTFEGLAMFAWSSSIESTPRQTMSSGQIPTAANNWGGGDYTGFRDAAMDRDIDAMERELDPAKRLPLWADMQRIYADQLPVLPLFYGSEAHVWPLWLKGVQPTGTNQPSSLQSQEWLAQ